MNRIIAIAFLQIKAAMRSKLFFSLVAVLLLVVVGLPMTIKGDGTLTGQIKIILYYTLGAATIILGLATMWTSSAAISQEIESRQLQLVIVKPVTHFEIWLGKWIGLLVMNAALLCFTGLIVWGLVSWNLGKAVGHEQERRAVMEELLVGRRLIHPRDTLQQEVSDLYHALLDKNKIPDNLSRDESLADIRKQLLAEKTVVATSSVKRWVFDFPDSESADTGQRVVLNVRFTPVRRGSNPVSGQWTVGAGPGQVVLFNMATNSSLDGTHRLVIPLPETVMNAAMAGESRRLVVEYRNGDSEKSRTVVFDRDRGLELFIGVSGFESNLVRSLLVVLCRLALLAAVGLTASTLFSFPVAAFTAFSILLVSCVTHYYVFMMATDNAVSCCAAHSEQSVRHSFWQEMSEKTAQGFDMVLEPVMRIDAVSSFSEGVLVSWKDVGEAVLIMGLLYSGLIGAAGVLLFRRRELALPQT